MDETPAGLAEAWESLLRGPARRALEQELPRYLAGCRWFGGKARHLSSVELLDAVPLERSRLLLLRVTYADADPEVYALPLALVPEPEAERVRAAGAEEVVTLDAGRVRAVLFAADREPGFLRAVVDAIAGGRRFEGTAGEIVATPAGGLAARWHDLQAAAPTALGVEQSNTSIRFGDVAILKLFRRTAPGVNPEVELGAYLTEVAAFRNVPPLLGSVEYRRWDGERYALALLQGFVANRGDAWTFTVGNVRALLDRVEGRRVPGSRAALLELAGEDPPRALRDVAAESLEEAALLGRRTAELHVALSSHREAAPFRPEPLTARDRRALHDEARATVRRGLGLLRQRRDALSPELRRRADRILSLEHALDSRLGDILDRDVAVSRIRTHGDYHLGQVLWTGDDFVIIDFEGEPARTLAERRAKASPLRDVAGMVRSFHYAARQGLSARSGAGPERTDAAAWAQCWYRWTSAAFLRAWFDHAYAAGLVPEDPREVQDLFDLYLTEKAVYELVYELNNRPHWVELPMEGIEDLIASDSGERDDAEEAPRRGSREAPRAAARDVRTASAETRRPAVLAKGGPGPDERHLWNEGTARRAYRSLGAHLTVVDGVAGTSFAVWAPNAEWVSVIGDFNGWDPRAHPLRPLESSGIWHGFIPDVRQGAVYKYHLRSRYHGYSVAKADPFGFMHEAAPGTQSIVWDLAYEWADREWLRTRGERNGAAAPMSVYEVHLGSWRRVPEEGNRPLTYREVAPLLADYAADMGFTHVELLPLAEHPFYGSWGYQTTGYFAPTSRYGTPQDLMYLVDTLHQRGIGVILDWVPSHFPSDEHGLTYFDGTHLYEPADVRQALQKDWDSLIFNYDRNEVRSFLTSSALFWLDAYHVDALRVDAVASMLYLDYSRKPGEWIPNEHGGRENLHAISFLRKLNEAVYAEYPDVHTIAEESTSWPMVSRPLYVGGLGFGMKWDMGWMHDTLSYMHQDPVFRKFHHDQLTFRMMYAFAENFVLPLSHDEVVHGKGSLLDKMPGQDRERFANLRLLLGYMWAQPGKKLLFMGGEFGQGQEWSHERSLDWHLLGLEQHAGVQAWVRDLNRVMREEPALHVRDFQPDGFEWIDCSDAEASVVSFLRRAPGARDVLAVFNFTPVPRQSYRVGVPRGGFWREILNGDAPRYGGSGWGNFGGQEAAPVGAHGRLHSLTLTLPPLSAVFFRADG